jgi:Holliday junction DNA helicase RuvA
VIIDTGGIGYEVLVPLSTFYTLPEIDEDVGLHIYTHVREDALSLFGFQTVPEKSIFLLLISVSGIGPKLAVNILSGIGPNDLVEAISHGDTMRLQAIPGVGKKMAERMALELRDKVNQVGIESKTAPVQVVAGENERTRKDALSALQNLGYTSKAAGRALEKALALVKEDDLEGLIRESLKLLVS